MAAVCVYILHHLSSSMTNVTLYRRLECWTLSRSRTRKIFIPRNSKYIVKIYSLRHLWEKSRDNRVSNARTGHFMVADDETLAEYIKFLRKSSHARNPRDSFCLFSPFDINVRVEKTALFPHTCFRLPASTGGCKHEPYCPLSTPRLAPSCTIFLPRI